MTWFFRILLVLNIAYCILGLATKNLPGWKMFEKVEVVDFSFRDAAGDPIDVRKYLAKDAYITTSKSLLPVLSFICKKGEYKLPLKFDENVRKVHLEIGPDNCKVPNDL